MLPPLIDTHAHLQDFLADGSLEAILQRAQEAGVVQTIAVGVDPKESADVLAIADRFPSVFAAVGFHPNHLLDAKAGDWEAIAALTESKRVVAIGETGLDRYWKTVPFDLQQTWFERHLDLAERLDLPVVIHCRDCQGDIIEQLKARRPLVKGVLHSFTGTWSDAQAFLDIGLHLSFAGMVTYKNKALEALREVAAQVPVDRLLVETDSPYLSPEPHRGRKNEPARVVFNARRIADVRNEPFETIAAATTENARRLFRLPIPA